MTTVREIERALFDWAPRELAMDFDNVGLLVGDPDAQVNRALVSLDITEPVVEEAARIGAQLIVSHHPVMNCTWHPVQTLRTDDRQGRILTGLIRSNIAAICMHTNLDAAEGGVNDVLADKLGLSVVLPLSQEKIGRYGVLKCEIPLVDFVRSVVKSLGCNGARYSDRGRPVHRVAVGGGACAEYIQHAVALGCDTFVTADLKYHEFLDSTEINLIDAGHFPTEDLVCREVIERLSAMFPTVEFVKTTSHCREVIQYCMKEN